jgi:hypothetical protein
MRPGALKHGLRASSISVLGNKAGPSACALPRRCAPSSRPQASCRTISPTRSRSPSGARALDMLLPYRGSVQTELFRALVALKALQVEAAARAPVACLPPGADSTERTQNPL